MAAEQRETGTARRQPLGGQREAAIYSGVEMHCGLLQFPAVEATCCTMKEDKDKKEISGRLNSQRLSNSIAEYIILTFCAIKVVTYSTKA